ncbi:hypothetical protein HMI54_001830 [Coelomomyces lativittatus]|nr:hypothetical protein HMI55_003853 [Coelomomyces lativittatus]KAJ1510151.1 hypothetical protein HMI54_001830 [Coelomomyces lativittatus]KAJ1512510.1 hypothetical protein HMI56_003968 [Coelomomyces lativittatus]
MVQLPEKLTEKARRITQDDLHIQNFPTSDYRIILIKCPGNIQISSLKNQRLKIDFNSLPPYCILNDSLKLSFLETCELNSMKVLVPHNDKGHFFVKRPDYCASLVESFKTSAEILQENVQASKRQREDETDLGSTLPMSKKKKKNSV